MVAEMILVGPDAQGESMRQGAQYVARGLAAIGYSVREQINVCDSVRSLQQSVAAALGRSHVLVILGGLGPGSDCMAKTTIASGLGLPLEMNNDVLLAIRNYCHRTGETYSLEDNELAKLPRGSVPFTGSHGKMPGFAISSKKQHIIFLPEIPGEIIPMFNRHVSPYLGGKPSTTVTRTVRTYGVSEQRVREELADMLQTANPAVTVQSQDGEVLVRVSSHADSSPQASALCTPALQTIVDKIGDAAYGLDVDSLQSALVARLVKKDLDLAVAESGTGGALTQTIAETEGGQGVLRYVVAVDDDDAKAEKLGLDRKLLKKRGGISEQAAVAMADAVRQKAKCGIGLAVTASTLETESKKCPAGLVYIAVCDAEFVYVKKLVIGDGDADDATIIRAALARALNMARLFVDYLPQRYPGSISLLEAQGGKTVTDKESYDDGFDEDGEESSDGKAGKMALIRKIVFILAVVIFVTSASYVGYTVYQSYQAKKQAQALEDMFVFGEGMEPGEVPDDYPDDYQTKFAALWSANPDVMAFIWIQDTTIKYPIVQSYDNNYYLRRDFYGEHNQYGVPFFDFRVDVKQPSDNMVVYGHNMDTSGRFLDVKMFGELVKYKDIDYYKEHPVIDFSTVYRDDTYKIFSVFITNAYENQGHVFDYYNFIEAESDEQFESFLQQLRYRSLINTTVDVEPGDELITLSTCSYEFKDMRTVVVARKTRAGESEKVDTAGAVLNPQPLYPDVWYKYNGGTKPAGIDSNWTVGQNASSYIGYQGDETARPAQPAQPAAAASAAASAGSSAAASTSSSASSSSTSSTSSRSSSSTSSSSRSASSSEDEEDDEEYQAWLASSRAASRRAASEEAAESSKRASDAEASKLASESAAEASRLAEASRVASDAEASRLASESASEASRLAEESRLASESAAEESRLASEAALAAEGQNAGAAATLNLMARKVRKTDELTVRVSGEVITDDAYEIICGVVENEVGPSFHPEAIKAQAVAAYTYIAHSNASGTVPSVYMNEKVSKVVKNAVAEVIGEAVYYEGQLAFTPYHATSAGATTSSESVWGGSYPYLVSVDSSVDQEHSGYKVKTVMTSSEVSERLSKRIGIKTKGDPSTWFKVVNRVDGGYVGDMKICGKTKSAAGSKLTGRLLRESVLNLRSANFKVSYNEKTDKFTFTTYGYGHGVGMSQNGANAYAAEGWSYVEILEHYYFGATVQ